MQSILRDLRDAFRSLSANFLVSLVAMVTIAIPLAANTAVFSILNTLFLQFPFPQSDRLVAIVEEEGAHIRVNNYDEWWEHADFLRSVAGYKVKAWYMSGHGEPARIPGYSVSSSFLDVLRVRPLIGRNFSKQEDTPGAPLVALISEEMWRALFASDPNVLGKVVRFDGQPCQIIGVLPGSFRFPNFPVNQPQFWTPLSHERNNPSPMMGRRVFTIGRLIEGVTIMDAQQRLNRIAASFKEKPEYKLIAQPVDIHAAKMRRSGHTFWLMIAAAALLLLIACANIASLLLIRAIVRTKEIAVRIALGSTRWQLVRKLLAESIVLCSIGGAAGLLLTFWMRGFLKLWISNIYPSAGNFWTGDHPITMDWKVVAFSSVLMLVTGLLAGIAPVLHTRRIDVYPTLKESGGSSQSFSSRYIHHGFVIVQIAIAVLFLCAGGVIVRSIQKVQNMQLGFDPTFNMMDVQLPHYKYPEARQQAWFLSELLRRIQHVPGISHAALASDLPMDMGYRILSVQPQGLSLDTNEGFEVYTSHITPDFLHVIGGVLLSGRNFDLRDRENSPRVALVNETFVRRFWSGQNPLGKRITIPESTAEIVGVVRDMQQELGSTIEPQIYFPLIQQPQYWVSLVFKSNGNPRIFEPVLRKEIRSMDPDLPVFDVEPMTSALEYATATSRSAMLLLIILGSIAVALAMLGLYGVVHYSTARQSQEIGIRISIGATKKDILKLVLVRTCLMIFVGIFAGVLLSLISGRLLESFLFDVRSSDALTYSLVACSVTLVSLAASWMPARRAAAIDPMRVLRQE